MKSRVTAFVLPLILLSFALAAPVDPRIEQARSAFADRDYGKAVALCDALYAADPDGTGADRCLAEVVRGLSLAKDHEAVVRRGEEFLARFPGSERAQAVAFLVSRSLLLLGRGEEAANLMAASLDEMNGPAARARVATYLLAAADRAFDGVAPAGPFDPGIPADYPRALRLYTLARQSGLPPKVKPAVLLRAAKAAVETKGYDLALAVLDERVAARGDAGPDPAALLLRGRALLGLGRTAEARDALDGLVAAAPTSPEAPEALLILDDPAHLDRLVRTYPDHPKAPAAAFRAGELLAAAGRVDLAVAAFDAAVDRFPGAPEAPRAALASADALFAAGRYEESRSRYDAFLRRWPESADFARARDRLTEAWYRQGADHLAAGRVDDAAKLWQALRATYPLSPLSPKSLLEEAGERKGDDAGRLLGELLARYPKAPEAPVAALKVADLLGKKKGAVEEAVAALKRVMESWPDTPQAQEAGNRLAAMKSEMLDVELPAPVALGESPALVVRTRNLRSLTARAWRIDPVAYFGRHASLAELEQVMVEVVAPDRKFAHEVADYEDYREIEGKLSVPVDGAGAWIVVLEGGKLRATGLLLVSGITVIAKESPRGVLAFAQAAGSGAPAKGARVLVKTPDGKVREGTTGEDGVLDLPFDNAAGEVAVLAVDGDSVAFSGFGALRRSLTGLETVVHTSTDRSLYRPGDAVRFRAVVRRANGEFRETPAGRPVKVEAKDGAGNTLYRATSTLSEFGTVAGEFGLPADLPPGDYPITVTFDEKDYASLFSVEAYRKPQVFLSIEPEKPVYVRGEEVRFAIAARYAFGGPIPGLSVSVEARAVVGSAATPAFSGVVETDAAGRAFVAVPTAPGPDLTIRVRAEASDVTRRIYVAMASIPVPAAGYSATLSASRDRLFFGEEVRLTLLTTDVLGKPVAVAGRIEVGRGAEGQSFADVARLEAATDESGRAEFVYRPDRPGRYRFRYVGTDRGGAEVTAAVDVTVLEAGDRVVVRAEKGTWRVGDTAVVEVASPARNAVCLLTLEGEAVYAHRVVRLAEARSRVEFPVTEALWPDARVRVAVVHEGRLLTGEDRIEVDQEIRVTVKPEKESWFPGETARIRIETADLAGKPVPAEVAVAVVDEGIFVLRPDGTPALAAAFEPPARADLVRTHSSLAFSYRGSTGGIPEELLAERRRREFEKKAPTKVLLEEKSLKDAQDAPFEGPDYNEDIGIGGGAGGAFGGRGGRRNLRAEGGGSSSEMPFEPRSDFRDTAFWLPNVITGADGSAIVEFRLPDDLTEWRVTARAASHGNAGGEGRGSFTVARPLVIRAALPRFLREGDAVVAAAGVVNATGEAVRVDVTLAPAAGGDVRATVDVASGREAAVDWPLSAGEIGVTKYVARAATSTLAEDAEERPLSTLPLGVRFRDGFAGLSTDAGERRLVLPADAVPGTLALELRVAPGMLSSALDGVEELGAFPYGCTEQTVNRFLPAVEAADAIRRLGLDASASLPGLDRTIRECALRLTYLQNPEGLWGWWRRSGSNAEMTAWALIGLARARDAGADFSREVFARAAPKLAEVIGGTRDPDLRAFLLLARSWALGSDFESLAVAFADRGRLGPRGLAHLALAYAPLGPSAQRDMLLGDLAARLGALRTLDTETLGFALVALAGAETPPPAARAIAAELLARKKGGGFGTTRETGAAVMGLARLAAREGTVSAASEAVVTLDGEVILREKVAGGPAAGRVFRLPAERLRPGENVFAVAGSGGAFSWVLTLSGVRREAPEARGRLTLARRLAIVPSTDPWGSSPINRSAKVRGPGLEPEVQVVRAGEAVKVVLAVGNEGGERYLVVEEPIPAGFEPIPGSEAGPFAEAVRHDDRYVFFLEDAPKECEVSFIMRSEAPGRVRIPAGTVYPMYRPEAYAFSAARTLTVAGRDAPLDRDTTAGLSAGDLYEAAKAARGAGRAADSVRFLDALLDRYAFEGAVSVTLYRWLAEDRFAAGDAAGAVDAMARLRAEQPGAGRDLEDEMLLSRAFRALKRSGEAVSAMEAAAARLFETDARVPDAVGGEGSQEWLLGVLDRYPVAPYSEAACLGLAERRATAFEGAAEAGAGGDPADQDFLREFLARYPESAAAPRIALRLARTYLRAGEYAELEAQARRFGDRYPSDPLRADADWYVAYALFAQGRYAEADAAAAAGLTRVYPDEAGEKGPSKYGPNLTHLRAQVAHVLGRLDEAVALYREVADVSVDANESLRLLTEERFGVAGVTRVEPGQPAKVVVTGKNVKSARIDLYPVDILVYFVLQKDVSRVAGLNLDGLAPAATKEIDLAAGRREREVEVDLGTLDAGVYLVIGRSGDRESRGILLVSDLEASVRRHPQGIRVLVTERGSGAAVPGAFVKVAVDGALVGEGRTDPRGVFEVRGEFHGRVAAVARIDARAALAEGE